MDEEKRKQLLSDCNMYSHGHSMVAMYENPNLDKHERVVMLYLGHSIDLSQGELTFKPHRTETIIEKTGFKKTTIRDAIRSLESRGYIIKDQRSAPNGSTLANGYAVTMKVFHEYREQWVERKLRDIDAKGKIKPETPLSPRDTPLSPRDTPPVATRHPSIHLSSYSTSLNSKKDSAKKVVDKITPKKHSKTKPCKEIPVSVLTGAVQCIYDGFFKEKQARYVVSELLKIGSHSQAMRAIEELREKASDAIAWQGSHLKTWRETITKIVEEDAAMRKLRLVKPE